MHQKAVQVMAVFYNSELNNVIITNKVARENLKMWEFENLRMPAPFGWCRPRLNGSVGQAGGRLHRRGKIWKPALPAGRYGNESGRYAKRRPRLIAGNAEIELFMKS